MVVQKNQQLKREKMAFEEREKSDELVNYYNMYGGFIEKERCQQSHVSYFQLELFCLINSKLFHANYLIICVGLL